MCKYCETQGEGNLCDTKVFKCDIDCGILGRGEVLGQIYKTTAKTEVLNIAIIGGNKGMDYEIEIKYCPMCGRKLKGAEEDV